MSILIVDDHPLVTEGLAARLQQLGHEVAVAHNFAEARQQMFETAHSDCVLDIDLGGRLGTELLSDPELSTRLPPRIIILSGTTDPDDIVMALDRGAIAFVPKSIPFDDVVNALVAATNIDVSPGAADGAPRTRQSMVWDQDAGGFVPSAQVFPKGTVLSPREREVFALMRQSLTDKQIAARLERSIHTIRVQVRSITRKRGTKRLGESI
jgi:two-component system, NarL family, nitrate/nitrite response regulator NarL